MSYIAICRRSLNMAQPNFLCEQRSNSYWFKVGKIWLHIQKLIRMASLSLDFVSLFLPFNDLSNSWWMRLHVVLYGGSCFICWTWTQKATFGGRWERTYLYCCCSKRSLSPFVVVYTCTSYYHVLCRYSSLCRYHGGSQGVKHLNNSRIGFEAMQG